MPSTSKHAVLVRRLQERAARALPAEHVEHVGGWWLRRSTRCAWWVGTVLPHAAAGPKELVRRVAGAERFYAMHGTTARFQISPRACPAALDTLLADRGYGRESPMSLQVAATTQVSEHAPSESVRVRLDDVPTTAWFEVWHAVHGHGGDRRTEWNMLRRVERPSAYASAMIGDSVVAVGRVVADEWLGGGLRHGHGASCPGDGCRPECARGAGGLGGCAAGRPAVPPGGVRQHSGAAAVRTRRFRRRLHVPRPHRRTNLGACARPSRRSCAVLPSARS